jgi:hypothetical protein
METGIFRPAAALAALTLGLAACGSTSGGPSTGGASAAGSSTTPGTSAALNGSSAPAAASAGAGASARPFAWLKAQAVPAGWHVATIPSGASMAYPPAWRTGKGDPGTATAALRDTAGRFLGYLNLTTRQGPESLANWKSFRPAHNTDEGDRSVRLLSSATGLHFLTGEGSCVKDSYMTSSKVAYIEIACLVAGSRGQSVIVGAAPPSAWSQTAHAIERAIEGVRT